jgi:hypothetical protein
MAAQRAPHGRCIRNIAFGEESTNVSKQDSDANTGLVLPVDDLRSSPVPLTKLTETSIVASSMPSRRRRAGIRNWVQCSTARSARIVGRLDKMYGFWSSVMLTTGRYKGNPLAVHGAVPDIDEAMFERWLCELRRDGRRAVRERSGRHPAPEGTPNRRKPEARPVLPSIRRRTGIRRSAAGAAQKTAAGGE